MKDSELRCLVAASLLGTNCYEVSNESAAYALAVAHGIIEIEKCMSQDGVFKHGATPLSATSQLALDQLAKEHPEYVKRLNHVSHTG